MHINRIQPLMPVTSYKTYRLAAPFRTHRRRATCAEIDCPAYLRGWISYVDESTTLGARQAQYIRAKSGRQFAEKKARSFEAFIDGQMRTVYELCASGELAAFVFADGQQCFGAADHSVPLEREPFYIVRGGDWRGVTSPATRHANGTDWVDDFGEHQETLADRMRRG